MNRDDLEHGWRAAFGLSPPVGHVLRRTLPARWLRIYALSGGKRYATSDVEAAEVLARMNAAAEVVLGADRLCTLFFAAFPDVPASRVLDTLADPGLAATEHPALARLMDDYVAPALFAVSVRFRPGAFDGLLRLVAEDAVGPVLFANLARRTAFAPYDGGADLFLATDADVATHRVRFEAWLSPRPDGL